MKNTNFLYVLLFVGIAAFSCTSADRNPNGYGEDEKGKTDTSGSIRSLQPDSTGATDTTQDPSHLDENNDQRGTRIKAAPDSAGVKR
ncbi:hypothetical protein [Arcticibacter sp. MXS-1]|uniref:hypothetical protein n=1 Tax=Arcticibacter sp. MXS-1 TaxID=3341726 RepID=UPI0035A8231C